MKNRALIRCFLLEQHHRITCGHVTSVATAVGVARREADWLLSLMLAISWLLSESRGGVLNKWVPRAGRGDEIRQIEKFLFVGLETSQYFRTTGEWSPRLVVDGLKLRC
ncbi:hypothetical protein CABS03_03107 [Colletotrichum abscissum]|uniref:Uncharacterized protein n=1 Tax=Colletotrichum abscissum TaxID=1671311 RepID=A0A9P9XFK5_9PEZI|nr:hypothetical protein CABS02_06748 [Colletotrichum abscissum]